MSILNDRNYRKYAIRKPKNIKEIEQIDLWARELTMKKIKDNMKAFIKLSSLYFYFFNVKS